MIGSKVAKSELSGQFEEIYGFKNQKENESGLCQCILLSK